MQWRDVPTYPLVLGSGVLKEVDRLLKLEVIAFILTVNNNKLIETKRPGMDASLVVYLTSKLMVEVNHIHDNTFHLPTWKLIEFLIFTME